MNLDIEERAELKCTKCGNVLIDAYATWEQAERRTEFIEHECGEGYREVRFEKCQAKFKEVKKESMTFDEQMELYKTLLIKHKL